MRPCRFRNGHGRIIFLGGRQLVQRRSNRRQAARRTARWRETKTITKALGVIWKGSRLASVFSGKTHQFCGFDTKPGSQLENLIIRDATDSSFNFRVGSATQIPPGNVQLGHKLRLRQALPFPQFSNDGTNDVLIFWHSL